MITMRRLIGSLVALGLVLAGTASSVAADPYPPEYRACVTKAWNVYEQQWQDLLAKYPESKLARRWYADRNPGSYEQALADPRTTQACPLEGGER